MIFLRLLMSYCHSGNYRFAINCALAMMSTVISQIHMKRRVLGGGGGGVIVFQFIACERHETKGRQSSPAS